MQITEQKKPIKVLYMNHKGKQSLRTIVPHQVEFGVDKWHGPEARWLMHAWDVDKKANRTFDLQKMQFTEIPVEPVLEITDLKEIPVKVVGGPCLTGQNRDVSKDPNVNGQT